MPGEHDALGETHDRPPAGPQPAGQPPASIELEAVAPAPAFELVAALVRAWQDIRGHHQEVPAVVLLIGPSPSRQRASRPTLGYFTPLGWSLPQPDDGRSLLPDTPPTAKADERADLGRQLRARSETILLGLSQMARELSNTRAEVFIATELVVGGATNVFAVLLHEAVHAIAVRRGIKDTSRQGRYHNARFRLIAEEAGLRGDRRDPDRGWSLTALSPEGTSRYATTLAQLDDAIAGRPGPQDHAATAALAGPACGCGQWVPLTKTRRPRIAGGTLMCDLCAERFNQRTLR